MMSWLGKNFWLKLVAFILAVITWFYAREELRHTPGYNSVEAPYSVAPADIPQK